MLNHRAVFSPEFPPESLPSDALRRASQIAILAQAAFALYYLALRFVL